MRLTICAFSLAILIAGCAQQDEPGAAAQHKVGVTFTNLRFPVFEFMNNAIRERAAEEGVEVISLSANGDSSVQLTGVENMITNRCDAVIINAVNEDTIVPAVRKCNEAGIPVVLLDRQSNGGDVAAYVSANSYDVGILQAEYVAGQLGGEGKVVIIQGMKGNSVARDITRGNTDIFSKHPGIEIVANQPQGWDRARAMTFMENVLQREGDIDAVLANNDTMIMGACQALKNAGMLDRVITVGSDADKDALLAVGRGQLTATVDKMPIVMALKSYELAMKIVRGEQIETEMVDGFPTVFTPSRLITGENLGEVTRWGELEE